MIRLACSRVLLLIISSSNIVTFSNGLKSVLCFSSVVPLAVTRCCSLSFVVTRCHLLSLVVTRCTTRCHSLSLVVVRCSTRLSFYERPFWNVIIPFKIRTTEKPHSLLFLDLWFLSWKKSFQIQWYLLRELELSKNWPRDEFFKHRKAKLLNLLLSKYLTFLYLLNYLFL